MKLGLVNKIHELFNREKEDKDQDGSYNYEADPELAAWLTDEVKAFSKDLARQDWLSRELYEHYWGEVFLSGRELIIGQEEYGHQHKQRFRELFNGVALLLKDNSGQSVLEFGVSEFSALYKRLFPEIKFDVADRPVGDDYIGFTPEVSKRISDCGTCFSIDLERPESFRDVGVFGHGGYDVIVFAEVLEHLIVNPLDLFRELIALLKADGRLLITTPNFFSAANMQLCLGRENPQQLYPGDAANWDGHYHYREYGLKEIWRLICEAGGDVKGYYFSDCCDNAQDQAVGQGLGESGTIVLVAGGKGVA